MKLFQISSSSKLLYSFVDRFFREQKIEHADLFADLLTLLVANIPITISLSINELTDQFGIATLPVLDILTMWQVLDNSNELLFVSFFVI